jgi:hypothetical protein
LKKKAPKVSILESTELASENVAKDVPESGNDISKMCQSLETFKLMTLKRIWQLSKW